MKTPLHFQMTEYDCGPISFLNAIKYLFDREEIPAEVVQTIYKETLDCEGIDGKIGSGGTSRNAIEKLVLWINDYAKENSFPINCTRLTKEKITLEKIRECIYNGGVVLFRCYQINEHYSIITDIDEASAYIFDPYYFDNSYYDQDSDVAMIFDEPFKYNRIVRLSRLLSFSKKDFSFGEVEQRECVLIERIKKS